MYGVVEIGGHQYKVQAGDVLDVEKLGSSEEGSTIEFDKVLFVGGDKPVVGGPTVSGAKVVAKVVRHDRDRKKIVFVRKPGLYQKKRGHRQNYTCLVITEINDGQGNSVKIAKDAKAQKYLK